MVTTQLVDGQYSSAGAVPPTDRPKPPEGYETWLDYCLDGKVDAHDAFGGPQRYAREELNELREEITELRVRMVSPKCKTCGNAISSDCPSCKQLWESVGAQGG